jgi:hypothetical protein
MTISHLKQRTTTVPARARVAQSHEENSILHSHRVIGNQAVQRLPQASVLS